MRERELSEEHSPSDVKQALAIASKMGGNMTGATAAIEKLSPGLSKHPQVAAVLKRANEEVKEGLGDEAHLAEQDHEVQMARAELYKLAKYAIKLHEMLKGISEREGLEGWVQSKITKSADMIGSVYHHLEYQESPMGEVTEATDTHCSDKCCGSEVKAEDCKCPPTCDHCNCNAVDEGITGAVAGGILGSAGGPLGTAAGAYLGHKIQKGAKKKKKKDETYKESLAAKLENVQQQRKAVAEDLAPTKDQLKGKELDALRNKNVAKMDAEDKEARKAQANKFAAIKKSADKKLKASVGNIVPTDIQPSSATTAKKIAPIGPSSSGGGGK